MCTPTPDSFPLDFPTYVDLSSFVRDIESASRRLEDPSHNTTVLAPLNSAVEKLPRKPWEDPRDYDTLGASAYEGGEGHGRAQRNLQRFVEAHLVPVSPWQEGEKIRPIGGDREIWWEEKGGTRLVSNTTLHAVPFLETAVANKM
jgi:hypothetical protein